MAASETIYTTLPVRVNNPRKLGAWQLPAERVVVGGAYKPSMALLPNGELVMVALFGEYGLPEGKIREWTPLWRSTDGGRAWTGGGEIKDMIGREQWLTCASDGTMFATCHLLAQDVNNKDGYSHSYLHGFADRRRFFVFDPAQRKVVHEQNTEEKFGVTTSQQGPRVFVTSPDKRVFILFVRGIAEVSPETFTIIMLAESPVPIGPGGDWLDGSIYFGSGSHVYILVTVENTHFQRSEMWVEERFQGYTPQSTQQAKRWISTGDWYSYKVPARPQGAG